MKECFNEARPPPKKKKREGTLMGAPNKRTTLTPTLSLSLHPGLGGKEKRERERATEKKRTHTHTHTRAHERAGQTGVVGRKRSRQVEIVQGESG